jgi:translation initiation factor 2B subunit (eIF-2B alpha/beta/delta family)
MRHCAIPFYVIADISKYTQLHKDNAVLENMPVGELDAPTSPFIHPENYYFDFTDAALISGYISEIGVTDMLPWQGYQSPANNR